MREIGLKKSFETDRGAVRDMESGLGLKQICVSLVCARAPLRVLVPAPQLCGSFVGYVSVTSLRVGYIYV